MPRQAFGERHELRVQALRAAVIKRLPRQFYGAQAVPLSARATRTLSENSRRERFKLVQQGDGVLAGIPSHLHHLVQELTALTPTGGSLVTLPHGLGVLTPTNHAQANRCIAQRLHSRKE